MCITIVSDIYLSGRDGISLLQELKRSNTCIPAIALTAFDDDTMRNNTREAGIELHLVKPVAPERLIAAMRYVLQRRPARNSGTKRV